MKRFVFICLGIFILAVVLRLAFLNSFPIFADESIYIRWAQVMRSEPTLRFLPLSDGKQPLFMWALIPMFKFISDPLVAGRVLSALSGIFTLPAVGWSAWLLFKKKNISLVSALVFAVVPYSVFFNRLALVDSLLVMFVVWGFLLSQISISNRRLDMAMLAGFAFGFAWLTKSTAMLGLALTPVLMLLNWDRRSSLVHFSKQIGLLAVTGIIAFAMYNILRLGPEFHMIALRNQDYMFPVSEVLRHPLNPLLPHLGDSLSFYFYLLTPIGLLLAVLGMFVDKGAHWRARLILSIWVLFPIISQSFVAKSLTARYLMISLPFAAILIAHALAHIGDHIKSRLLFYASIALFIVPCLVFDYLLIGSPQAAPLPRIERAGYLEEWTAGFGLQEVSQQIAKYSAAGPVVVGSEGFFGTPFDALSAYLNNYKNVRVVGVGVKIDSLSDKLTNALKDNQVFLVVNSSRFQGDPDKMGLKLLASYPKAMPPSGIREYLLFFRVLPR